jgi:NAD(P)H-dependent flavin oxidoreductase YrpB (nitropropane dioxygenase family)
MRTRACDVLKIEHPIVLGGMASGTNIELVAAVSNAGGLGTLGCSGYSATRISELTAELRANTDRPFGLNLLLFRAEEASIQAVLAARPAVFASAWPWPDFDLRSLFARAHDAGARVTHMVSTVHEALHAAEAGADVIVAQGTEGGGHVGVMGTMVLVPQVVRAVAPVPVLAAGGIVDGAGLAAALMLGAEGVLLGTRFLATPESPLPDAFKQAIVGSDGHDTVLTELPDVVAGQVWPGAYARVLRTGFIQEWIGRENEVRRNRAELRQRLARARQQGNVPDGALLIGQDSGLIDSVEPAGDLVRRIVADAERILNQRVGDVMRGWSLVPSP